MPAIVCLYDDARGKVEIPTDGHVFAAFTRVGNELAIVGNEVFLRKGDTWAPLPTAPLDGLHTYVGDGAITAIGQYTNVPGHPVYYRTLTSETTWVADGQATFFPGWETWQFLLPINGEREAPLWGSLGGKLVIEAVGNNRQEIGGPAAGRFGNGQGDFAVYEAASVRHFGASEVATPLRGTDVRLRFAGTGELLAYGRLDGCDGTEFVTVVR
jgi:hypothetical protein